jgi:hypothetical protein
MNSDDWEDTADQGIVYKLVKFLYPSSYVKKETDPTIFLNHAWSLIRLCLFSVSIISCVYFGIWLYNTALISIENEPGRGFLVMIITSNVWFSALLIYLVYEWESSRNSPDKLDLVRIVKSVHSEVTALEEYTGDIPFNGRGVSLNTFNEVIKFFGGREAFIGKTTDDVCKTFIKDLCQRSSKSSFIDLMVDDNFAGGQFKRFVRETPNVFISHAWQYNFLDIVDAMALHFTNEPNVGVWFDLFANDQNNLSNKVLV